MGCIRALRPVAVQGELEDATVCPCIWQVRSRALRLVEGNTGRWGWLACMSSVDGYWRSAILLKVYECESFADKTEVFILQIPDDRGCIIHDRGAFLHYIPVEEGEWGEGGALPLVDECLEICNPITRIWQSHIWQLGVHSRTEDR